jgi:pimeloyl-ACP methyl ester carboxylesterase
MLIIVMALGLVSACLLAWTALGAAAIARRHPPTGRFVPVTGGRLHVVDQGPRDAPPHRTVVLLHGATGNLKDLLLPLGEPLVAAGFRVIAIDRPGLGWSDRPGGKAEASPARQAALIAEAMGELGIPRALVVGYSLAGTVATSLAMDHPHRVAGLQLLCPVSHPWPGGIDWYYRLAAMPALGAVFSWLLPLPVGTLQMPMSIRSVFAPNAPPTAYAERAAIPLILRPQAFRANGEDVAALFAHASERAGQYGRIACPVAIITGLDDRTVWPGIHTFWLGREIPDCTVDLMPGVGHMPHHQHPDKVVESLETLAGRASRHGS